MGINDYYVGMPCMLGDTVGRIIGESDEGSWGRINGIDMFSMPLFATPHGTVIKTGIFYLSPITNDGNDKLSFYENLAKEEGIELYAGKLPNFKD